MLISLDSWIVVWWWFAYCYCFWCFSGGVVIHWLTNEVSGGGVVLGESWDEWRSDWGRWLFIWLWFMEFGLTCGCSTRCAWSCEVGITGDSGGQVKLILNIDWSLWWLVDWCFLTLVDGESGWLWWWMMNDDSLFWDRWLVFRLRFTCYLLLMFFVLCDLVNCRVVWGFRS